MSNDTKETLYSVATDGTMYIHYDEEHQLARIKDMTIQLPQEKLSAFLHTAKILGISVTNDKYGVEE